MNHSMVMTGASRGLGRHAAVRMLHDDPGLHLAVIARGSDTEHLAAGLAAESGNRNVTAMAGDLTSLAVVRDLGGEIGARLDAGDLPPLAGFAGNAGVQFTTAARVTPDGYEATFAVNVLANYLLIRFLHDRFTAPARIVITTSDTHFGGFVHNLGIVPGPRWDAAGRLAAPGAGTTTAGRRAYSTSKLGVIYLVHALARRLPPGVDVYSFNPGLVPGTGLARDAGPISRALFRAVLPALRATPLAQSPEAAGNQLAAAAAGRVPAPTGAYISKDKAAPSSPESYDQAREEELWQDAASLTAIPGPPTSDRVAPGGTRG